MHAIEKAFVRLQAIYYVSQGDIPSENGSMTNPPETHRPNRWQGNCHVYFTPIQFESRLFKITRSLATNGFAEQIYIVGVWEPGLARHEVLDEHRQIRRFRLFIPRVSGNAIFQLLRLAEFSLRALLYSFGKKVDLVNCHMLMVFPVCVLMKKMLSAQLVYEPHENEADQECFTERQNQVLKLVEKTLLRHANMVVHCGHEAARLYEETYGIRPVHVLNNTPYADDSPAGGPTTILRDRFQIATSDLIFLYQGQLLEHRGITLMLSVFSACPDKTKHLVFMGFGACQEVVEEFACKHSNIHFLPAVPPDKIMEHTAGADVGFSLLLNTCNSYRFANPNKLNEYFIAGIPTIVSDLPSLARFVREKECGWVVEADHQALAALVARITREEVDHFRKRIEQIRRNFGWEQEEKTLVRIYEELWARRK